MSCRFSAPVSRGSTAANWPVTPIAARTASASVARVVAGDADLARVRAQLGREDAHGSGLAGAVRAQQREDRPGGDVEVEAVEHGLLAEPLGQTAHGDGGLCHGVAS